MTKDSPAHLSPLLQPQWRYVEKNSLEQFSP